MNDFRFSIFNYLQWPIPNWAQLRIGNNWELRILRIEDWRLLRFMERASICFCTRIGTLNPSFPKTPPCFRFPLSAFRFSPTVHGEEAGTIRVASGGGSASRLKKRRT